MFLLPDNTAPYCQCKRVHCIALLCSAMQCSAVHCLALQVFEASLSYFFSTVALLCNMSSDGWWLEPIWNNGRVSGLSELCKLMCSPLFGGSLRTQLWCSCVNGSPNHSWTQFNVLFFMYGLFLVKIYMFGNSVGL